ncbi:hypothetical protein RHGRI_022598 [Rhododendron griersonianum]|uniref:Phospholipase D n=1 Tax=Rhododendron griersonianum TaxID=479676 RepID=A0AAV6J051_9ERIC|nr:hypothetical protein RHGRI_022598 [Rhododendron griersonianum]
MAEERSERVIYMHGDLHLTIKEARNLPNMDLVTEHLRRCFTGCDSCYRLPQNDPSPSGANTDTESGGDKDHRDGHDMKIRRHRRIITSDPYVTVCVPQATLARTRVIPNAQDPKWNEEFYIPMAHPAAHLEFHVKDNDIFGAQLIGKVLIQTEEIAAGGSIGGWYPVIGANGEPPKLGTALRLEMTFTPCDKNPLYQHVREGIPPGIAADPEHKGVRHTYFSLRKGSAVQLYQDAHFKEDSKFPEIQLDGGKVYEHGKCWEDMCHAIIEAHHLIYIVGWSVYQQVKLIREPTRPLPRGGDLTLGELLKYKSEEGVRVLLLVWDDKTSHDKFMFQTAGVMQTHDEELKKFFKNSSVICMLSPRYASSKHSYIKQKACFTPSSIKISLSRSSASFINVVGSVFTHHQKSVLVDTQASRNYRKITAFLGGLDLCDGRYDTPEHRLFHDLDTVFRDDYHNPTFPPGTRAPRQPWHDLHCRIDGPAAYDVLINFEQRWKKATKWTELGIRLKKKAHWHDDALIKIDRISWILSPQYSVSKHNTHIAEDDPRVWVSKEDDPENWHVQNLICSKNMVIDRSIQTAYIQAIRSAHHFIYIENQYFIGSSYAWPSYKEAGADNLVPMELALKIANKIRAKERFAVYIVIPMWPEGDPNSAVLQEILFWQELKSMQLADSHLQDYLNFYCLGKREEMPEERQREDEASANGYVISDSEKFQRFMIYVHAKGMIVDDEYVIVGSANINQRSLAGTKDTEIAMGAYQPHHTWAEKQRHPRGQIYGYRMSLWAEQLGMMDSHFNEPESLECVRKVNQVAEDNRKRYIDHNFTLLQGHLIKYPIQVDDDGKVGPLPGFETFPDIGGRVLGAPSPAIPDILTT